MKIDLHIHTRTGSDGSYTVEQVFAEAHHRGIEVIAVTDHDSIAAQKQAMALADAYSITCITGIELNVTFEYSGSKPISLDFLGYRFDIHNQALNDKLSLLKKHRDSRALQIMDNLNEEFGKEGIAPLTEEDLNAIQETVDGTFGRPHIANYLVDKGITENRQEAFDKYLVKCDVPKYPLSLPEASELIHNAGGFLVLAHPCDPNGTSLVKATTVLEEQGAIISRYMLNYIDGVECWHSRLSVEATAFYQDFCLKHNLMSTGGSDCHQKPVIMGTVPVPDFVAGQFI